MSSKEELSLRERLNAETARITWRELQRFFAQGKVIAVAQGMDLVDVAVSIAEDNADVLAGWKDKGLVQLASDAQARAWIDGEISVWAVVVAPWIIVQPGNGSTV